MKLFAWQHKDTKKWLKIYSITDYVKDREVYSYVFDLDDASVLHYIPGSVGKQLESLLTPVEVTTTVHPVKKEKEINDDTGIVCDVKIEGILSTNTPAVVQLIILDNNVQQHSYIITYAINGLIQPIIKIPKEFYSDYVMSNMSIIRALTNEFTIVLEKKGVTANKNIIYDELLRLYRDTE